MKKKKNLKSRFLPFFLVAFLIAAAAFNISCEKNNGKNQNTPEDISITVTVTYPEGNTKEFSYTTGKTTLRGVLEENGLIEGEESEGGLYVKVVDGVTADYDTDKSYWAFYKSGEYLMTGIDDTMLSDGDAFEIVYTK